MYSKKVTEDLNFNPIYTGEVTYVDKKQELLIVYDDAHLVKNKQGEPNGAFLTISKNQSICTEAQRSRKTIGKVCIASKFVDTGKPKGDRSVYFTQSQFEKIHEIAGNNIITDCDKTILAVKSSLINATNRAKYMVHGKMPDTRTMEASDYKLDAKSWAIQKQFIDTLVEDGHDAAYKAHNSTYDQLHEQSDKSRRSKKSYELIVKYKDSQVMKDKNGNITGAYITPLLNQSMSSQKNKKDTYLISKSTQQEFIINHSMYVTKKNFDILNDAAGDNKFVDKKGFTNLCVKSKLMVLNENVSELDMATIEPSNYKIEQATVKKVNTARFSAAETVLTVNKDISDENNHQK